MIPKVLFGHDPKISFQSIEKIFQDCAQKRIFGIMPKVIFKVKKNKNYFGHDTKSSFWARSQNILIEKMFWDRARKRTFGIMPKVIFKLKF